MKRMLFIFCVTGTLFLQSRAIPAELSGGGENAEPGVIPVSGQSFTTAAEAVVVQSQDTQSEEESYWGGSLEKESVFVSDPENKNHKIFISVSKTTVLVFDIDNKNPSNTKIYRLDLKTGEITVLGLSLKQPSKKDSAFPRDSEDYLKLARGILEVVNSAYNISGISQQRKIGPVANYVRGIESHFVVQVSVVDIWRARTDAQFWNDSRAITGVEADSANNQLILHADFDANGYQYGKGEVYIYIGDIAELSQGQLDINAKKLVMEVFIPEGFINDPKSPDHLRLFVKSGDSWAPVYGIWRKVDYEDEDTWVTMELDPMADPVSWRDANFDPTKVWELGLSITKGSGKYRGDGLRIRNIRIDTGERVTIQPPAVTDTPPVSIQDFVDLSGRNLNFSEYNYGWCVGEFPVIWGQGEHGGFSNPRVKENLRQALTYLKGKGISTVRLMALFGDLRTGILQDQNGNFIYDEEGNLQFDSRVYDDVKAFLDVLQDTGMKAVVGLFDFRVADDISREGERNSSWAVGEHAEIITDSKAQSALVDLFSKFFAKVYSGEFVNYDVNDVVLFWEVMNEPEAVCAADFSQVVGLHDRFFGLIRNNAPGAKVTTSSLSLDSAYRFWKDKVDVISVHHYPDIEKLELYKPVGNYGFGDKQVIWTEFGDRNLAIPAVLTNVYVSGAEGILFWQDSYYQFSETDYQAWVDAVKPK